MLIPAYGKAYKSEEKAKAYLFCNDQKSILEHFTFCMICAIVKRAF